MFESPISRQWPELIADVETDVVAFFEHHKIARPRRSARQAFSLGYRDKLVARPVHHQERAFDPLRHVLQRQSAGDLIGLLKASSVAADAKRFLRDRGHGRQHLAKVERAAV